MGFDPMTIGMVASAAANAAGPLIAGRGADPKGAVLSQVPRAGQQPQGMQVGGQVSPDFNQQAMQVLLAMLSQFAMQGPTPGTTSAMQQAIGNVQAGPPVQSMIPPLPQVRMGGK